MGCSNVPEKESAYPVARMFGMLPVSGLYVRHARNLHFDRLEFSATRDESRPTLLFDDVEEVHVANLESTPVRGNSPVVRLADARSVTIADSAAPAGTDTFLSVSGSNSANVVLAGDDLRGARHAFQAENGASAQAITFVDKAAPANH